VFARKLKIELAGPDGSRPAPHAWLEQFFLRDFTGYSAFDETLPKADGLLEAGSRVDIAEVRTQLEKWLRGRKMIGPETELRVTE
jgi:hypothetical protein